MRSLISRIANIVSVGCLIAFATLVPAAVVFRFVLKSPIGWIEPVCAILLVQFTFATAIVATCENLHVSIGLWIGRSNSVTKRLIGLLARLTLVATFGTCSYFAIEQALETSGQALPEIPELPASSMYWPIAIGCALMMLVAIEDLFKSPKTQPSLANCTKGLD